MGQGQVTESSSRRALHRCLVRHGISRLPKDRDSSPKRPRFAGTRIGYVHVDSCQLRSAEGKMHMFLAIDRMSKFAYVERHATAEMATGGAFMRGVVAGATHETLSLRLGPSGLWLKTNLCDCVAGPDS